MQNARYYARLTRTETGFVAAGCRALLATYHQQEREREKEKHGFFCPSLSKVCHVPATCSNPHSPSVKSFKVSPCQASPRPVIRLLCFLLYRGCRDWRLCCSYFTHQCGKRGVISERATDIASLQFINSLGLCHFHGKNATMSAGDMDTSPVDSRSDTQQRTKYASKQRGLREGFTSLLSSGLVFVVSCCVLSNCLTFESLLWTARKVFQTSPGADTVRGTKNHERQRDRDRDTKGCNCHYIKLTLLSLPSPTEKKKKKRFLACP